jgi:Flp pilus assembly protein TadG
MIMKSKKNPKTKSSAQAMVEFAIALPILLMLLYGILEAGRLMFLYSTVVTASRQAVRYGTAIGQNASGTPHYQDCAGIRASAQRAAFLGQFNTVTIYHDDGVDAGTLAPINQVLYCSGSTDTWVPVGNSHRIVVEVSEPFTPIVPKLVPFINRIITARSARTIFVNIPIVVTPPGGGGAGGSSGLTLTASTNPTSVSAPQNVAISYVVTNTGATNIATPITITTNRGSWSCSGEPGTLTATGGSFTCSGSYAVTQADLNAGTNLVVTASATAGGVTSPNANAIITISQSPALALAIDPNPDASGVSGTVITYTFTLTNTGNVTLQAPYAVNDNVATGETCPSTSDLVPGASTTCTGTYTLKNSDINAGKVNDSATATAKLGSQTITSNTATGIVYTPPVYLTVTASPTPVTAAGQVITYTYTLTNNIAVNELPAYTVNDSRSSNETCPGTPAALSPGASVICTGTYTVTQADMNAGAALAGTVSATAQKQQGNGGQTQTQTSNTATTSVAVVQNPALNLTVTAAPNPATVLNTVVTYTYTLTNTGNVTLSPTFAVTDNKATGITCTNPAVAIAPGATKTCTGTRTLTQADLDDGSVINTASASAAFGAGTITSNSASVTVITFAGARLTLVITANPNPVSGSGQIVTYTYTLKNTGNVVLSSPYTVTSTRTGSADCSAASATIPVGGSTACVGFYTTQPGDVSTSITDSATATAMNGAATVTSNNASLNVPVNP